jgi:hypothetical protein
MLATLTMLVGGQILKCSQVGWGGQVSRQAMSGQNVMYEMCEILEELCVVLS